MKRPSGKGWKKAEGRGRELRSGHKFLGNAYSVSTCATFAIMTPAAGHRIGCSLAQSFLPHIMEQATFGNLNPEHACLFESILSTSPIFMYNSFTATSHQSFR